MTHDAAPPALATDLLELAKPRITLLVTLTTAAGFAVATPAGEFPWLLFTHTVIGTGLVAAGSAVLNQYAERDLDARMRRTALRPLPAGRRQPTLAFVWGALLAAAGIAQLAIFVNALTSALAAATLAAYLFAYTPLKTRTSLATIVGAVPGAAPPLLGWTGASGELGLGGWILFALLFLWQLPHFLAIAWLYRDDYLRAGMPLLTTDDPDFRRTKQQTVLWAVALLPVSLMPAAIGLAGRLYLVGAILSGAILLGTAIAFARAPRVASARRLLLTSVFYLPAVLGVLVVDRIVG